MKKILILLCALLLLMNAFTICFAESPVRIAALKGPTAMGMIRMMEEQSDRYDFTLAASADTVVPQLIRGELDAAAVPANLASILYNNTSGAVRVLAINTLGVMYIVERGDSLQSVEDLRGKTLYTSGKGSVPEYALNYILTGNGLDPNTDLQVEYKSEHSECLSALMNDPDAVAMLPQPFATVAMTKSPDIRIALDLTAEWDALQASSEAPSAMITGVILARSQWIDANPDAVNTLMQDYASSVQFTLDQPHEAAVLIGKHDIFEAGPAEKALPYCNITFIAGEEMKAKMGGYLKALYEQDPASVGGKLPDEIFYYET